MKRVVIFASGSGTNAENIVNYFQGSSTVHIPLILSNNPKAQVLDRAKKLNVAAICFNKEAFSRSSIVLNLLKNLKPDLIVLAGFLWKIPDALVAEFPNKIINIHPALLPKFGGKGMYGHFVHEAVVQNKETESGITIHFVNEHYDEGAIIFQARCPLQAKDSPSDVEAKVRELEMKHFPKVIESLLKD